MRLPLRKKLYFSFLIIIVLFLVTASISTILTQRIVHFTNDILVSEKRLEAVQRLNLFARTANDNGAHYLLAPLYIEDDFKSQFEANVKYLDHEFGKLEDMTTEPSDLAMIRQFWDKWKAYVADRRNIMNLKKAGKVTEAQNNYTKISYDPIAFALHAFSKSEQAQIDGYKSRIEASGRTIQIMNLFMVSLATLLSLFIAIALSNSLIRRILLLRSNAQTVASGNLQVPDLHFKSKDELTDLANSFNAMTESLRSVMDSNQFLQQLSFRDGLTGIANRRCYDESLEQAWVQSAAASRPISLILLDIDCFKRFNDIYGHQAGDLCLKQVADLLQEQVRESGGLAARYGGEEFAVLLAGKTSGEACQIAEHFQKALAEQCIPHTGSDISEFVTVSIGISNLTATGENAPDDLLIEADHALYQAKEHGRNRICVYAHDQVTEGGLTP
ncbi:diguanylate cyclase [Paenibacillus sp. YPG26]|uniref:diguanylate cyclase domain-containing protein n=1 Tax=Paenibacillus sp. YPG26 TaxID=2878915 RepID=UPI00203E9F62|nr:diguanylate cyclase [Paenibacillus sp. YPG26]USB33100.1 diguanylate cyclase [Paenibacillus sp. YPG26]